MEPLGNDRWRGSFIVDAIGRHEYTVAAWVDHWVTWRARPREAARGRPGRHRRPPDRREPGRTARPARRRRRRDRGRGGARTLGGPPPRGHRPRAVRSTRTSTSGMRRHPDRDHATTFDPSSRSSSTRARPLLELVRAVPALHVAEAGPPRHAPRRRSPACRTSPGWASTSSTCRRSTRSGATFRKGTNNALERRARRPRQPVGDRRRRRAATRPSTRSSARSTTSTRFVAAAREHGHRDRARHRVPVLARPPVRAASTRSGSGSAPTARSSTPRTRRRSTRTSTRSTSSPTTGARCGRSCCAIFVFWIDHGVRDLPRRQPAHQAVRVLGVADRRGQARASRT